MDIIRGFPCFFYSPFNLKKFMEIVIRSSFGHEIMACCFANAFDANVLVIPNKETKEEYEAEQEKIVHNLSFLSDKLVKVPFDNREAVEYWDIIGELKAGTLSDEVWADFAKASLVPTEPTDNLPQFAGLKDKVNILMVPQKLISDGECGVSAAQQSLNPQVFNFLKGKGQLVLGQHFHKLDDLATVQALAKEFDMYVPGMTEDTEVFGIRGVQHKMYYNMYNQLSASVGIAGTHTWIMLAMFPDIPQIILYNRNGVEHWDTIAEAFRANGKNIYAIGFDENTDMAELSKVIEEQFNQLF